MSTVGRDESTIREYIRNQEKEDQRIDQMNLWKCPATVKVAQPNRGRVSDPTQAALSGSHNKAPGSAGGYLLRSPVPASSKTSVHSRTPSLPSSS